MSPDAGFRYALRYVRPYWPSLALVIGLSLASTVLSLFVPYLAKLLIDGALVQRDPQALLRVIGAFAALTVASFGLNVASGLRYTHTSARILFDMRLALFRHLQRLSPRFYARMPLGQVAARINTDIAEIQRVAAEVALAWVGSALFLVGSVIILIRLDAVLFAVSLVFLPPALWALVLYRRRLDGAIAGLRDRSADLGSFLIESLQAMKLVAATNTQGREVERFRGHNEAFIGALMRMRRLTYLAGGFPGLLLAAGSAVVLYVGGARVIDGSMTIGTLVAFIAYQVRLMVPVQALMGILASVTSARVSLRRVQELFDEPLDVQERPDAATLRDARGALELRDVALTHGRGGRVLDGVTLRIEPGERVALVGASGEGKSTIADLLARHVDPDGGAVHLDGHDLRGLRLDDVRRHVVCVDQDPFIFHATLADNIRLGAPAASDAAVLEAAHTAGLGTLLARMPDGIATSIGERGRTLSAGERQRVAIARALLASPAVLVLDEATGALDEATEAEVIEGYERLMRGRTTIVITHRPALAQRADRIVELRGGRIVADRRLREPGDEPVPAELAPV